MHRHMQERSVYEEASVPKTGGYRDISPAATCEARGRVRLIDVREPSEFNGDLGHIAGAELVPLATISSQYGSWDKDAEIILICRSGGRSIRAAEMLSQAGFRRVMNLAGGMLAYYAEKLPVERD